MASDSMQAYILYVKSALMRRATAEKARASERYFPNGAVCLGVNAADIKYTINEFHQAYVDLTANDMLAIVEALLADAKYNEEVLCAFGLLNKFVKRHYDDRLLDRFKYWLEHYASNWAMVDDLCIKTIYLFLLSRPHLIEQTQHWARSEVCWCRRASNVVWVKFIERKIGKEVYRLDKGLVFKNCDILLSDPDEFVQKSIGWLLKVTAKYHQNEVVGYIQRNITQFPRATLRYAIEKMDINVRQRLLSC
ncbi:DNA alkylation repair protein [Pseudoalteromonas sp. MMG012]|uniref:DNA alkylation repair protein n=1 Tax=Pseudoalteromonas sp. MMG012 TaxID=2822686 RepID=UPI001FFD214B|nr:DNA alkylation repair protein [Pseudoalteromonas sp. MMG012]